jgi:hypothetical protein
MGIILILTMADIFNLCLTKKIKILILTLEDRIF